MPEQGQLIALDGSGGWRMMRAAKQLQRAYRQPKIGLPGISRWDASGIFFEINEGVRGIPGASPRTLLLLYAADLAFRLRWEIRPGLESGRTVIAAPYLESAIAFGRAAGIPQAWLKDLFGFAPKADAGYSVPEDKVPASRKAKASDCFFEFGFRQLRNTEGRWNTAEMYQHCQSHLAGLRAKGRFRLATNGAGSGAVTV